MHAWVRFVAGVLVVGPLFLGSLVHADPVTLTFTIEWTDSDGTTHPARDVRVQFIDDNTGVPDTPLADIDTDAAGVASTVEENADVEDGTLDPYITYWIDGPSVNVSQGGTIYGRVTPVTANIPGPTFDVTRTIGNVDDFGHALSIHQAVCFLADYAQTTLGSTLPAGGVDVVHPSVVGTKANATTMWINGDDWQDWDVIGHEYGHVIAFNNNLQGVAVPENHTWGTDNIGTHGNDDGSRLAWQEGIAYQLSFSAMVGGDVRTAIPGLPATIGDVFYDDTVDVVAHISMETRNHSRNNVGEGDEGSVARILWDYSDSNADAYVSGHTDSWALGPKAVYDLMPGNVRFSDFWADLVVSQGTTYFKRARLGETLQEYEISARLVAPVDDVTFPKPQKVTFSFAEQNSGYSSDFMVVVFDVIMASILDQSPVLHDGTTTWISNVFFQPGVYSWVVLSNPVMLNGINLATSYWSGYRDFIILPEPSALVLIGVVLGVFSVSRGTRRPGPGPVLPGT